MRRAYLQLIPFLLLLNSCQVHVNPQTSAPSHAQRDPLGKLISPAMVSSPAKVSRSQSSTGGRPKASRTDRWLISLSAFAYGESRGSLIGVQYRSRKRSAFPLALCLPVSREHSSSCLALYQISWNGTVRFARGRNALLAIC